MVQLLKHKYTAEDLLGMNKYVSLFGVEFVVKVCTSESDAGILYPIQAQNVEQAIFLATRYYDSICSSSKYVELLLRERTGEIVCLYHVDSKRSGLSYDILDYVESNITL